MLRCQCVLKINVWKGASRSGHFSDELWKWSGCLLCNIVAAETVGVSESLFCTLVYRPTRFLYTQPETGPPPRGPPLLNNILSGEVLALGFSHGKAPHPLPPLGLDPRKVPTPLPTPFSKFVVKTTGSAGAFSCIERRKKPNSKLNINDMIEK